MTDTRRRWKDGGALLRLGTDHAPVPLEIAASYRARTRGLLGRDGIAGALLLTPAGSVHTFRMRFAIDVAYLDRGLRIIALTTMPPGRLGLPRLRSRHVLEAEAGAMASWGLRVGSQVDIDLPDDLDRGQECRQSGVGRPKGGPTGLGAPPSGSWGRDFDDTA